MAGYRNAQGLPFLPLAGGTMSGALNMGAQAITNAGDITSDNASGFKLENAAASTGNPTIIPNRSNDTDGWGHDGSDRLVSIINGTETARFGSSLLWVFTDLTARAGINNDTGDVVIEDDLSFQGADTDRGGAALSLKLNAMSATLSAAGTHSFTSAIPAGATVVGVTTRVTTTITGCTSISIGDGTDVDRFGVLIALTSGTTTTNADWTITSTPVYAAATNLVITAVGGGASFTAGAMRVCVYYLAPTAPTS